MWFVCVQMLCSIFRSFPMQVSHRIKYCIIFIYSLKPKIDRHCLLLVTAAAANDANTRRKKVRLLFSEVTNLMNLFGIIVSFMAHTFVCTKGPRKTMNNCGWLMSPFFLQTHSPSSPNGRQSTALGHQIRTKRTCILVLDLKKRPPPNWYQLRDGTIFVWKIEFDRRKSAWHLTK